MNRPHCGRCHRPLVATRREPGCVCGGSYEERRHGARIAAGLRLRHAVRMVCAGVDRRPLWERAGDGRAAS